MRIGELSSKAGVNIQTVRFYEREQLLREPTRTASGYRCYEQSDLERMHFIKQWQRLGFTLKEIKQLLKLHARVAQLSQRTAVRSADLRQIRALATDRLAHIEAKIALLDAMRKQLVSMLAALQDTKIPVCPVKSELIPTK